MGKGSGPGPHLPRFWPSSQHPSRHVGFGLASARLPCDTGIHLSVPPGNMELRLLYSGGDVAGRGPLPGPKSGLLSNTQKRIVRGDTLLLTKQET